MFIIKIEFLGWELIFQKSYFTGFHYTDYISNSNYSEEAYELNFSIDKRIKALAGHHRYIEWTFASFNEAIKAYGIDAIETLNCVIESLVHIRNKLKIAGATEDQLKIYDNKVYDCFKSVLITINNRIYSDDNSYKEQDIKLLNEIKDYDIDNYHNEDNK